MEELRVDMRERDAYDLETYAKLEKLVFRLNQTMPRTNVFINSNLLAMARGSITIEDDVQIAANVQLLTNNHDPYDRAVLTCKPIDRKSVV